MKNKPFLPILIDVPKWARKPDIRLHKMTLSVYESIQPHREIILDLVHKEVLDYLNTEDLVYDGDEDGFPHLQEMTGEYYIGDESYEMHVGPPWIQIGIETRFLEKKWCDGQTEVDYLSLHVWIKCDPKSWKFEINGNTDSAVI